MTDQGSGHSIIAATRGRAKKSAHGGKGAAGRLSPFDETQDATFLSRPGETAIVQPHQDGCFDTINIGVAWDILKRKEKSQGFLAKLLGKTEQTVSQDVDLDLGCLYRLKDGTTGALQAFGQSHGDFNKPPYIHLSGDERTGEAEGDDETLQVNGAHWEHVQEILIYIYIYDGAQNWDMIRPQIQVHVPGETPMVVKLKARREELQLCAIAGLENIRGGIKMTNYLEYFPGHASMDRAFGYGLHWEDGQKD